MARVGFVPKTMATAIASPSPTKSEKRKNAWKNLPDVWALIKPRRGLLALGFVLMAINRVSGLVLPGSMKYFVDNVVLHKQMQLLTPIVLAVLGATIVQGLTSFSLTQLLSKSAQKMITDLRRQVQAHIGRLPIAFYDANKTGVLVSRIMSDVEGIRNLLGIVSVLMMEFGGHKMLSGSMTPGQWFAYNAFLAFLIAPVFQIVAIGTQITEAITGLERTREILNEKLEDETCELRLRHAEGSFAQRKL